MGRAQVSFGKAGGRRRNTKHALTRAEDSLI